MKQLTKEQQEQAVELIEKIFDTKTTNEHREYIQSAKAFLQSIKPKVYVGQIRQANTLFFYDNTNALCEDIEFAYSFDSVEQAQEYKAKCEINFPNFKHFILTE